MNLGVPCPERLYSICMNTVSVNLPVICHKQRIRIPRSVGGDEPLTESSESSNLVEVDVYAFNDQTTKLNEQISQELFAHLCQTRTLDNLSLGLFTKTQTNLRNVIVKSATLSLQILRHVLRQHNVVSLTIDSMQVESIDQVIDCLNEWSCAHLKSLTITNCKWRLENLSLLDRLVQLHSLNLSRTFLNNHQLDCIASSLGGTLESLDISYTRVDNLRPLERLGGKLRQFRMFAMMNPLDDSIIGAVCSLKRIQKLDLSSNRFRDVDAERDEREFSTFNSNLFLESLAKAELNELTHLDISAWVSVDEESVCQLVRAYPNLKFLGLALINMSTIDLERELLCMLTYFNNHSIPPALSTFKASRVSEINPNLSITGELNHRQLAVSLKTYMQREFYSVLTLIHLFWQTVEMKEINLDLVKLVLEHLDLYIKNMSIVWVGTFCLINLTRSSLIVHLANTLLTPFLGMTLKVMKAHSSNKVIIKNCIVLSNRVQTYFRSRSDSDESEQQTEEPAGAPNSTQETL